LGGEKREKLRSKEKEYQKSVPTSKRIFLSGEEIKKKSPEWKGLHAPSKRYQKDSPANKVPTWRVRVWGVKKRSGNNRGAPRKESRKGPVVTKQRFGDTLGTKGGVKIVLGTTRVGH